jgi:hypothetical protein
VVLARKGRGTISRLGAVDHRRAVPTECDARAGPEVDQGDATDHHRHTGQEAPIDLLAQHQHAQRHADHGQQVGHQRGPHGTPACQQPAEERVCETGAQEPQPEDRDQRIARGGDVERVLEEERQRRHHDEGEAEPIAELRAEAAREQVSDAVRPE